MSLSLLGIRDALEGSAPAVIATSAADGEPNVSYLSDVQYVDARHIALSFQFFNKTRANVLANPIARLFVIHALTGQRIRLLVQYLRTETEGALFERMRARLAGIASQYGMADVFMLRGADVYRVLSIDPVPGSVRALPPRPGLMAPLRAVMSVVLAARELDALFDEVLEAIAREFDIAHLMLLVRDAGARRLNTVASRGYPASGVGAEVAEGDGVIGVAAQCDTPIRINHALSGQAYARAVREQLAGEAAEELPDTMIPLPGLARPGSQMALPVRDGQRVLAVLYVEHSLAEQFGYDLEDALATIADAIGLAMRQFDQQAAQPAGGRRAPARATRPLGPLGPEMRVRRQARTDAIFIDDEYVIRGVAGAVLWKMLSEHARDGRREFTQRGLRSDPALVLPEVADNLAARLILLRRRLDERSCGLRISRCGRGRWALELERPISLLADCASA